MSPQDLASELLVNVGSRLAHVVAVAQRAYQGMSGLTEDEGAWLLAAAWTHDVGYSPLVVETGFHPLDGARFLTRVGHPAQIVELVAYHSCASYEAEERGLTKELQHFREPVGRVFDTLVWADMTTGPSGEIMNLDERIAEILSRYAETDPVHRAMVRARSDLGKAVSRTEARLRRFEGTD